MEYNLHNFPNIGVISSKFTDEQLQPIKNEIEIIQNNFELAKKANNQLAGHIKKEYALTKSKEHLEFLIRPLFDAHSNEFKYMETLNQFTDNAPTVLNNTWVNFQEKTEFNPPHTHSGIYSFVIWIKIPFLIEDELKQFPDISKNLNKTASFGFNYINSLGMLCDYSVPADKTFENTIFVFPSKMSHYVFPFYTSNEYRISVSGNLAFKVLPL
jgi:hypothetical protein